MTLKVSNFLRLLETPRSVLSILAAQVIGKNLTNKSVLTYAAEAPTS